MKSFSKNLVSLLLAVLVATMTFEVPAANAQGLFEALFGGSVKRYRRDDFPPRPRVRNPREQRETRRSVPPAKIAAPSYYNYKTDALKRVDFAKLASLHQSASLEQAEASPFRDAVSALEDYELYAEAEAAKAIIAHYAANPDFIWVSGPDANDRAREAVRLLGEADGHGLFPADYTVAIPRKAPGSVDPAARQGELIRFEMALTARVLRYARDAVSGRINPNRLSGYHDFAPKPLDMEATLKSLSRSTDVRAYLERLHPRGPEYDALRVELEALRASSENEIVVDAKLFLKPGQSSPELAKLLSIIGRDHLDDELGGAHGELLTRHSGAETYVEELVPAIKAVQAKVGLKPDGIIGPRTVAALAGTSKADRIDKVLFALEQLRWLPSELGSPRVFINQPAYTASFIEEGSEKLKMRVVIGKPTNQTSFFYDEIEQIDYNPYWGVPQSIIVNEMLPRLRNDPGYLDRAGYEVTDARGRRISSSSINWWQYGAKVPYNVRQTPSEANALGELKILFPNKHAIYMHDTPQKKLFERDARAFSHGCVRLHDPRGMAAAVLGTSVDHVARKISQGHSSEKVTRKIPVYVAYFTAWPDSNGKIEYFADVYDRDTRLKLAMEKTDELRAPSS